MDSDSVGESAGGIFGCLCMIVYAALVLVGGGGWIGDHYGSIAAILSILALFIFGIPLPLMIGSVFYLIDEYNWNGFLAFTVVFLPGLPLMMMMLPIGLLGKFRNTE